jgi:hypothetical protein
MCTFLILLSSHLHTWSNYGEHIGWQVRAFHCIDRCILHAIAVTFCYLLCNQRRKVKRMLPRFRLLRRQGVEIFFFPLSLLYIIMIISMPTHKSTP